MKLMITNRSNKKKLSKLELYIMDSLNVKHVNDIAVFEVRIVIL